MFRSTTPQQGRVCTTLKIWAVPALVLLALFILWYLWGFRAVGGGVGVIVLLILWVMPTDRIVQTH